MAGYVAWNMVLDLKGGPRWNGGAADAPIAVDASKHEYYKQADFYVLGHFSKFIVPDSIKIGLTEDKAITGVYSTAFERPDGGVVVVVFNHNNEPAQITIKENNQQISHAIKANSIQTYIYY